MPRLYLFVPQGCYIEILPETIKDYIGLATNNMTKCSPVVVATAGHAFLCHADTLTDVSDESFGVPAWVESIAKKTNFAEDKKISISYVVDVGIDSKQLEKIKRILTKKNLLDLCEFIPIKKPLECIVDRFTGRLIGNFDVEYDDIEITLSNNPKNIEAVYCSDFVSLCVSSYDLQIPHPPVKIFNPLSSRFLSPKDMVRIDGLWFKNLIQHCINEISREVSPYPLSQTDEYKNPHFREACMLFSQSSETVPITKYSQEKDSREEALKTIENALCHDFFKFITEHGKEYAIPSLFQLVTRQLNVHLSKRPNCFLHPLTCTQSILPAHSCLGTIITNARFQTFEEIHQYLHKCGFHKQDTKEFFQDILTQLNVVCGPQKYDLQHLRFIIGAYFFILFSTSKDLTYILEGKFIEHLELSVIAKLFEVNFVVFSSVIVEPLVICNNISDKKRTIYLAYDVSEQGRCYKIANIEPLSFNTLSSCLRELIPEMPNRLMFYLPPASDAFYDAMVLLQQQSPVFAVATTSRRKHEKPEKSSPVNASTAMIFKTITHSPNNTLAKNLTRQQQLEQLELQLDQSMQQELQNLQQCLQRQKQELELEKSRAKGNRGSSPHLLTPSHAK